MLRTPMLLLALLLPLAACDTPDDREDEESRAEGEPDEDTTAERKGTKTDRPARPEEPRNDAEDLLAGIDPTAEASAQHILIRYQGARRAGPEVTRTKEQARERAQEVLQKARGGGNFDELVAQYSEEPRAAERKGNLGIFTPRRMVPEFSRAVFNMQVGQVSDIVETPFGFHVIKRLPIERASAQHILIMHKDSMRVPEGITRTKEEAQTRAREVLRKAKARDADFTALAREYTDEPQRPGRTPGDLGTFGRGQMVPEFETAVFGMRPGQISDIVETPFGYHIIKRTEPDARPEPTKGTPPNARPEPTKGTPPNARPQPSPASPASP